MRPAAPTRCGPATPSARGSTACLRSGGSARQSKRPDTASGSRLRSSARTSEYRTADSPCLRSSTGRPPGVSTCASYSGRPNPEFSGEGGTFPGSPDDRRMLEGRGSRFRARWDRAHGPYLHHQKSWLVDAGHPSEVAFVGGINPTARALGSPGHDAGGRHDAYVELNGPAATDVHHNFVQRWNEASERDLADGRWGHDAADRLPF